MLFLGGGGGGGGGRWDEVWSEVWILMHLSMSSPTTPHRGEGGGRVGI